MKLVDWPRLGSALDLRGSFWPSVEHSDNGASIALVASVAATRCSQREANQRFARPLDSGYSQHVQDQLDDCNWDSKKQPNHDPDNGSNPNQHADHDPNFFDLAKVHLQTICTFLLLAIALLISAISPVSRASALCDICLDFRKRGA